MDREELKNIIIDQNSEKISNDIVEREVMKKIDEFIDTSSIVILIGIRRTGKSTLLNEIMKKQKHNFNYLNFDDYRLVKFELDDFKKLEDIFFELYGEKKTYYFDEIQNINLWERFVRTLHDRGLKIFITGSNASMLSSELGTHLTGRNIPIKIFPFSFKEFLKFNKYKYKTNLLFTSKEKITILKYFNQFLKSGGIPEYLKTKKIDYLKNIYENILFRDVAARYKITNTKGLKDLVYYLISNIGKEFSYNKLKLIAGVKNSTTVKDYIDYLENSFLIQTVSKFDYSLKKQIIGLKKVYSIDNGLSESISFKFSEDYGRLLENLVFIELKRNGKEIYYHKQKKECDFIIKEGLEIVQAIQVCKSLDNEDTKNREINGLLSAMNCYNLNEGLIITQNEKENIKIDGKIIKIIPIYEFLLK